MFLLRHNSFCPFYSPDDAIGMTVDDIFAELGKDEPIELEDKKKEEKPKEKDKEESEEESEEEEKKDKDLDELEDELKDEKEPEEAELELVTPVSRKEILKKYPNIFKEFPGLQKAYYREQQYTEIYPTLDEAREANEKAQALDNFEIDLGKGDTTKILKAIKDNDPQAFNQLADNYLNILKSVDEKSYNVVVGNVVSYAIYQIAKEGQDSQNEEMVNAAKALNKFFFNKNQWVPPQKLSSDKPKEDNTEKNQLENERKQFMKERYESVSADLYTKVNNAIRATIDQHIDPRDSMPPYVKKNAVKDALELVNEMMVKDKRFIAIKDKLWEKAASNKFNESSISDLKRAFLGRAKALLPVAIKQARIEALKGIGKRVKSEKVNGDDEVDDTEATPPKNNEQRRSNSKSSSNGPKPGESSLEFLMRD